MKKTRLGIVILLLIMLCACAAFSASAESGTDQNISWTVKNKVLTISGKGAIPNYWTLLGPYPPWSGQDYTKVVIKEGITATSKGLFYEDGIEEISLPDSLEEIALASFYSCRNLKSVVIPSNVTSISSQAFKYSGLKSVTISQGVKFIEEEAFFNCAKLEKLSLPDSIGYVWHRAFAYCALKNLRIPSGMWSIGEGAFGGNPIETIDTGDNTIFTVRDNVLYRYGTELLLYPAGRKDSTFVVPDDVTRIGEKAFDSCKLTAITLPPQLESIGDCAFCECSKLREITIPKGVTEIPELCFYHCKSLQKAVLPAGLQSIGKNAFSRCVKLAKLTLPEGLETIGESAFSGCALSGRLTIPEGVKQIQRDAFWECRMSAVSLPVSLQVVAGAPFNGCENLKTVYYAGTRKQKKQIEFTFEDDLLLKIRWYCAGESDQPVKASGGKYLLNYDLHTASLAKPVSMSATKLTIPDAISVGGKRYKVTEIEDGACKGMKRLKSLEIGKNVVVIGKEAFRDCKKLKDIRILTAKLEEDTIGENAFKGTSDKAVVRCPEKCLKQYEKILVEKGISKKATFKKN